MFQIDFNQPLHVYFAGIGGISMSGLAEILKSRHFIVSGSDQKESDITDALVSHGIPVHIGQKEENITPDIDLAVFTAAIHPDNPEYVAVRRMGIPSLTRAELLGQIMKNYPVSIAVSGTHGKTTTTSMISEIQMAAEADPTLSIGGILPSIGGQVRVGHSGTFVAEACEYTDSFLSMYPRIALVLNIEEDHLDYFKDLAHIRRSFRTFMSQVPEDGAVIINGGIEDCGELTKDLSCRVITFGLTDDNDYWAEDMAADESGLFAYALCRKETDGSVSRRRVHLLVPGVHNVLNSLAAFAACSLTGIPEEVILPALASFTGSERRFEKKGMLGSVQIVDDYAHHPTEIRATLTAAASMHYDRVVCVFQPHTFTRTKSFMDQFASALSLSDLVILADIYPARETDDLGISSRTLQEKITALGHPCLYFDSFEKIEDYVRQNCHGKDLLITMGAGDVYKIGENLLS